VDPTPAGNAQAPPPTETHDPATAALLRGLNAPQRQAVLSDASPLRILAGAGSGKTRVLTHRIAHRSTIGTLDPNRVLAVTFTRKAAGELRERLGRLGLRGGIHAGTFHSIAYAQLRQRWEERGVRPPELLERKVGFVSRLMGAGRNSTAPFDVVAETRGAAVTPRPTRHRPHWHDGDPRSSSLASRRSTTAS
jgi:DNA helicase-2/ATP-dependent DNA helicase PcrA